MPNTHFPTLVGLAQKAKLIKTFWQFYSKHFFFLVWSNPNTHEPTMVGVVVKPKHFNTLFNIYCDAQGTLAHYGSIV